MVVFNQEGGESRHEGGCQRAACQQAEEQIRENIGGNERIIQAGRAEGACRQDLADQPGNLAKGEGDHDHPGSAGDLLVGGGTLLTHERGLYPRHGLSRAGQDEVKILSQAVRNNGYYEGQWLLRLSGQGRLTYHRQGTTLQCALVRTARSIEYDHTFCIDLLTNKNVCAKIQA